MSSRRGRAILWSILWTLGTAAVLRAAEPAVEVSGHLADGEITVERVQHELRLSWVMRQGIDDAEFGNLVLDLRAGHPLIRTMSIVHRPPEMVIPILENADPVTYLLVGSREAPAGRPPGMSVFNVFFDSPARRPFQTFRSKLDVKRVRVSNKGHRTTVAIGDLAIGPFQGELQMTVYARSPLVHMETVIRTHEDRRAILYDTGLALEDPRETQFAWIDTEGESPAERCRSGRTRSCDGRQAPRPDRPEGPGRGRLLPASPPVLLPARPDRERPHGLVRQGTSRPGRSIRLRHPPVGDRRRLLRPLVQRTAGHRATPRRLLPPELVRPEICRRRDLAIHASGPVPRPPGPSQVHHALAHGHRDGGRQGNREGRTAIDTRFRPDVQVDGRGYRPPGRVPRRRPPARPRPGPSGGDAGDVRRMPAPLR